jgi:hypothetical protein
MKEHVSGRWAANSAKGRSSIGSWKCDVVDFEVNSGIMTFPRITERTCVIPSAESACWDSAVEISEINSLSVICETLEEGEGVPELLGVVTRLVFVMVAVELERECEILDSGNSDRDNGGRVEAVGASNEGQDGIDEGE